jgi:hypothetical protein
MKMKDPLYYEQAHRHSINHREEVLQSDLCGCFYCRTTFPPTRIREWTDEINGIGQTALCPRCGIDSVIGSASGLPVQKLDFLRAMRRYFFRGAHQ